LSRNLYIIWLTDYFYRSRRRRPRCAVVNRKIRFVSFCNGHLNEVDKERKRKLDIIAALSNISNSVQVYSFFFFCICLSSEKDCLNGKMNICRQLIKLKQTKSNLHLFLFHSKLSTSCQTSSMRKTFTCVLVYDKLIWMFYLRTKCSLI
jgi:hypothetical protein